MNLKELEDLTCSC